MTLSKRSVIGMIVTISSVFLISISFTIWQFRESIRTTLYEPFETLFPDTTPTVATETQLLIKQTLVNNQATTVPLQSNIDKDIIKPPSVEKTQRATRRNINRLCKHEAYKGTSAC